MTSKPPDNDRSENLNSKRHPRRFFLRFGLKAILILILLIGGGLGWIVHLARAQRESVAALSRARFWVTYRRVWSGHGPVGIEDVPPWPSRVVAWLDPHYYLNAVWISDRGYGNKTIVDSDLMAHISNLSHVEYLDCVNSPDVKDEHLVYLSGLTRLESLDLSGTSVRGPGLVHLKNLTRLKTLRLGKISVTDRELASFANLVELRELSLNQCQQITDLGLAQLRGLTKLRQLRLIDATQITTAGLDSLKAMTELEEFTLKGGQVESIESLSSLKNLTYLNLSGNRLTDAGTRGLAGFPKLFEVNLSSQPVGDETIKELAKLELISRLSLAGTKITDTGLVHLQGMPNLVTLILDDTSISDTGIVPLARLPKLYSLSVHGTNFTEAGFDSLATSWGRRRGGVYGTIVSQGRQVEFNLALPRKSYQVR